MYIQAFQSILILLGEYGKKKAVLEIENDSEQDKIIEKLKNIENIQVVKDLSKVKKIIFVKNKILNIVI